MQRKPRRDRGGKLPPAKHHAAPESAPGIFCVAVYDVAEWCVLHHKDAPADGVAWPDIWLDVGTALVYHGWRLPDPDDPATRQLLSAAFIVGTLGRQALDAAMRFLGGRPDLPAMTFGPDLEKILAAGIADGVWICLGETGRMLTDHGWEPGMLRQ